MKGQESGLNSKIPMGTVRVTANNIQLPGGSIATIEEGVGEGTVDVAMVK